MKKILITIVLFLVTPTQVLAAALLPLPYEGSAAKSFGHPEDLESLYRRFSKIEEDRLFECRTLGVDGGIGAIVRGVVSSTSLGWSVIRRYQDMISRCTPEEIRPNISVLGYVNIKLHSDIVTSFSRVILFSRPKCDCIIAGVSNTGSGSSIRRDVDVSNPDGRIACSNFAKQAVLSVIMDTKKKIR